MPRILGAVLTFLIGAVAAGAQTSQVYLLRTGTIVDTSLGAAYVAQANGSIERVDLSTGGGLWTSRSASLPIGASDAYVVGQADPSPFGTLAVVFLDVQSGVPVSEASIPLPAGAVSIVTPSQYSGFFTASAEADGSDFVVRWYYISYPEIVDAPPAQYSGSARVDPRDGTVISAEGGAVTDVPEWYSNASPPQPWQAGSVTASINEYSGGPILLKRTVTATGQALPDVLLTNYGSVWPSLDTRDVMVEEQYVYGGYRMRVVTIETGETIADFLVATPVTSFVVFDGAIISFTQPYVYVSGGHLIGVPGAVIALSLPTGVSKWSVIRRAPEQEGRAATPRSRSVRH